MNTLKIKLIKKTIENFFGNLADKSLFLAFRNILPSMYFTLLNEAIIYGTIVIEIINNIKPNNPISKEYTNNSVTNTDIVTPTQNIRFQKLSLFILSFSHSIITLIFSIYYSIVLWLKVMGQAITVTLVVLTITLYSSFAFADNLTELIKRVEREQNIPVGLLKSIAKVESGIKPYALNIAGKTVITGSLREAQNIIDLHLKRGLTNIDIGVMQLNYYWHGKYFNNTTQMLDPKKNIEYAARLLNDLRNEHGTWHKAVRHYHCNKPKHHKIYSRKIIITWVNGR